MLLEVKATYQTKLVDAEKLNQLYKTKVADLMTRVQELKDLMVELQQKDSASSDMIEALMDMIQEHVPDRKTWYADWNKRVKEKMWIRAKPS